MTPATLHPPLDTATREHLHAAAILRAHALRRAAFDAALDRLAAALARLGGRLASPTRHHHVEA